VSRIADADETFSDINEHVSSMISTEQSSSLWQMRTAVSKPDIEIPDLARKPDLPACPVVSLYGIPRSFLISSHIIRAVKLGFKKPCF